MSLKDLTYRIYRPSGNNTGLLSIMVPNPAERKKIADALQKKHPNIEQVGFVNLDIEQPELMMTGEEFCGNATCCAANYILNGKVGEIKIKVSGTRNKLRAGINSNGETYSQIPIYPDLSCVTPDSTNPTNMIVKLQGITHYIDFDLDKIKGLTNNQIKIKARQIMAEKGLDTEVACGVIFAKKEGNSWIIYPVVYVRDADTLYYETACGSGSTALGLFIALKQNKSVQELPIIQPSGLTIKVSIDFSSARFNYAQIQSVVAQLHEDRLNTVDIFVKKIAK